MPALSSTMTEGKVRLLCAFWQRRRRGLVKEERREREKESLARFEPVASRGKQKDSFFVALFLSLHSSRIRCFLLRNWSILIRSADWKGVRVRRTGDRERKRSVSIQSNGLSLVVDARSPLEVGKSADGRSKQTGRSSSKEKRRALDPSFLSFFLSFLLCFFPYFSRRLFSLLFLSFNT